MENFVTVEMKQANGDLLFFDCYYHHSPAEHAVFYYPDGSGYPGADEYFEIYKVVHRSADISELIDLLDGWEKLNELAYERFKKGE